MRSRSINYKILTLLLCFLAATTCFIFSALKPDSATAAAAEFEANPFEEIYEYGDTLEMPTSLKIVSGEKTYTANKRYVRFPDGTIYVGGKYVLDNFGEYSLIYEAEADGKKITATHSFCVKTSTYSAGKSSYYKIATLNADFDKNAEVKGLSLNLAAGETFTYNKPVNVYENATLELIKFNVMHFDPIGKEIVIKLTDCYDPSRYIELVYKKELYNETYMGVGANGKAARGLTQYMNVGGSTIYIDGQGYKVNANGALIPSNRKWERHVDAGLKQDRYNNMTVSLDTTDKDRPRVYVKTAPENIKNELIAELNNSDVYGYSFGGFTTGDVIVSITAKTVIGAETVEVQIASLCGVSGEDLAGGTLVDENGPEIVINSERTSLNVMAGVPITVPAATAFDSSGIAGKVDYCVYYGYGTTFRKNVNVKNGSFTPLDLGTYTVVYTAKDVFGNKSEKTFVLNAIKEGKEGIDFTCEKISDADAGSFVSLAGYRAKSLNTTANVSVSVTGPDGKQVAISADMSAFCEGVGEYTVKYDYYDDLYSGSYTYKFTAKDGGISRFEKNGVILPDYMIKGATYSVDKINAYKYSSVTPLLEKVNYTVSYDGKAFTDFNPDEFTVTGNDTLKIRYTLASDSTVFIESKDIKIVDAGYGATIDGSKYFAGSFAGRIDENTPDYASYALSVTDEGSLDFINPLLMSTFSFRYSLSGTIGFYTMSFTDYYDRANKVTAEFVEGGIKINGVFKAVTYNAGEPLTVSYANGNLVVGEASIPFATDFKAEKILFGLKVNEITEAGELKVYSVCNQTFGYYVTSDNVKPIISVEHADRVADIGDVITLYAPEIADVLSPSAKSNCVVSVYKDGKPVTGTNGVLLSNADAFAGYSFRIDAFGSYLVLYRYTDGSGKVGDDRHAITVTDTEIPSVTLDNYDGKPVQASVNAEISPAAHTVKDNITASDKINVTIVVYNDKGVAVCVTDDKFTLTKAGKYTVYIYCTDEAGNTAYVSYELIAK